MKKNSILLIMFISLFFIFDKNVFAACKDFGNFGSAACLAESEDGFKCEYNASRKGGARCYKSKNLSDDKISEIGSTINSCSEIKEGSEVCNKTKINGIQCFYSHGVCTNKTDSDGSGETIVDGTVVKEGEKTEIKKDTDSEYYTGCPLGVNVTKDIYGLLKILKIVVPILVIGLTILEGVRAVAKGEIVGEEKKLAIRFVKRLIIAVILFFLPVLVNQIMIMANIWDENGTCDFSKTAEVSN